MKGFILFVMCCVMSPGIDVLRMYVLYAAGKLSEDSNEMLAGMAYLYVFQFLLTFRVPEQYYVLSRKAFLTFALHVPNAHGPCKYLLRATHGPKMSYDLGGWSTSALWPRAALDSPGLWALEMLSREPVLVVTLGTCCDSWPICTVA